MNDLDELIRDGLHGAVDDIEPLEPVELARRLETGRRNGGRRHTRRMRQVVGVAVAVSLIAVVAVVGALQASDDGSEEVHTAPETTTTTTVPEGVPWEGMAPGWHTIDTGPVPATNGASLAWTGSELVLVGRAERGPVSFAYDPATETWRDLGEFPLEASGLGLVWTGSQVLAVEGSFPAARAAVLDPGEREGWKEIDHPPASPELVVAGQGLQPASRSGPALVWTGERVLDLTHGSAWDPTVGRWSLMPVPDDPVAYTHLISTNPVWDGTEAVAVAWLDEPGLAWDARGEHLREVPGLPIELVDPTVVHDVAAVALDGSVVLISGTEDGRTATRDPDGRWTMGPPVPGMLEGEGCPGVALAVGKAIVAAPCFGADLVALVDGSWLPLAGRSGSVVCCSGELTDAGGALVTWRASTDDVNGSEAPYLDAAVWVPPPD